ncbi:phosphatidate cytidylyltransferase [Microbacterium foliorum]|uniref:phosphatidate cytidylyltransferase n=1 Tax=Microbacterium foliorum TaxID=104336 RepID=UPI001D458AC8|nr:phosphatidate cytidylyltransferase [Microbacterium foliorum]CAH0153480.1 Phosphatidate cytidylyltransferase [Microbacterium foliorum]CAH0209419.1 Phosphatidate cytidylyltransferase [Microbacterium foliorum]
MSDDPTADDTDTPPMRRKVSDAATPGGGPLEDRAFPAFDPAAVPPRPPVPDVSPRGASPAAVSTPLDTADHNAIREQWRAARDELGTHVSNARGQLDQANERIKERTGRDLILAILIGLAFGAALLASLLFIKVLFVPFALAAALLGVYELSLALRGSGRRIDVVPQFAAATMIVLSAFFLDLWLVWIVLFLAVAFVIVWRLVGQMIAADGRTYGDVLGDAVIGGFVQIYVPFLAAIALILLKQEDGQWWVLSFIAIAVAADTGAYAAGLAFGRHPMAPKISPKKTWEGFAGAVVASVAAGVLLALFLLQLPWWIGVIFGAAILLSATLGDLGESMLKRDLGIKDMSSWLPGHGGLLDRLDSILPSTIPALCLYFLFSSWMVL